MYIFIELLFFLGKCYAFNRILHLNLRTRVFLKPITDRSQISQRFVTISIYILSNLSVLRAETEREREPELMDTRTTFGARQHRGSNYLIFRSHLLTNEGIKMIDILIHMSCF
ncbi:hypothetical protein EV421DRAFT_1305229 [Armillaria borealis]|uniref:Secreted protein n=1 Tax=Armillaria borealis TaxID=47425 RepID=A0AA39JWA0_9AGAR|nr:hypothetical protein EV421DRAFT_1305229 [Armillaria borealis]